MYESVVAQELRAHGHKLFYYDNRKQGEVDYLVDDHSSMAPHPIEVKSGKDYTIHSALNNLMKNPDYHILSSTFTYRLLSGYLHLITASLSSCPEKSLLCDDKNPSY